MMLNFGYNLVNANHLTGEQVSNIKRGLDIKAFVCQQEFEKQLDLYHEINVIPEADDEAFISKIEIDEDEVIVELDCSKVTFNV